MNSDIQNHVVQLLKSYRQRKQRIDLLRYELLRHTDISGTDVIDSMTFGSDNDMPHGSGHSHDKILYIMLNYQKFADKLNAEAVNKILAELVKLEKEQDRLRYYVSLLDSQEAQVIRKIYFDGYSWDQVAEELDVVRRTAHKIKERALENLAWMYEYIDGIEDSGTPPEA